MRVYITILALICSLTLRAEQFSILSCSVLEQDKTAIESAVYDLNNDITAAVILTIDSSQDIKVIGNIVRQVRVGKNKYIVYITDGTRKINIYSTGYLPLELDFSTYKGMNRGLKGGMTYSLCLKTIVNAGSQLPRKDYGLGSNVLMFKSDLPLSKITVNEVEWKISDNMAKKLVPFGQYHYVATNQSGQQLEGEIEVTNALGNKVVKLEF